MPQDNRELRAGSPNRAWPLYGAALLMAVSLGMVWTAMPFILTWMGGTPDHVGYAPAVNAFAYLIALLVAGSRFSHLPVRRTTLAAGIVALLAMATMSLAVLGAESRGAGGPGSPALMPGGHGPLWIWMLIAAGGVGGATMALYWPFLMSWVSADYEGVRLNRRLGRYNGAWSSGGAIGPLLGGWLFEINAVLPLAAAVLMVLLSQLLLRLGRDGSADRRVVRASPERSRSDLSGPDRDVLVAWEQGQVTLATQGPDVFVAAAGRSGNGHEVAAVPAACDLRLLADCRWVSRIGLFSACACLATVRSQFALVFRDLGYAESQFGVYLTLYALCNFLALVAAGRWARWHFKPGLLIVGQVVLLLLLGMTIYGRALSTFFVASTLLGVTFGFAYSSHLYYGTSTSRRRSARMVIHEGVISLGLTTGSFPGGYLTQNVDLYAPYWFAVVLVGLGLLGQIALHAASRARAVSTGRARDLAEATEP